MKKKTFYAVAALLSFAMYGCETTQQNALTVAAVEAVPLRDVPALRERAKLAEDEAGMVVDACDKRLKREPEPLPRISPK